MPRLRISSNRSMLFLAIAVLPDRVCCCSDKDDAVAAFLPPSSSYTTSWDSTRIIRGDALAVMRQLPSDAIDLVVTSPPYNVRNSTGRGMTVGSGKWLNGEMVNDGYYGYGDAMPRPLYVEWQRECLQEMTRLIKPEGAIFYVHRPRVQGGIEERSQGHR